MSHLISFLKAIFFLSILIKTVRTQTKCNLTIPFNKNDESGMIIKNPMYTNNIDSCWYILKAEEGYGLTLEFQNFNLQEKACFDSNNHEACCDYLQIGTGTQVYKNLHDTFCGTKKIEPIVLESNSVWFNFHTDESINLDGFRILVKMLKLSFSEPSGLILSPEIPIKYINNLNLTYKINTEENTHVYIRFEKFSIEKFNNTCIDYLEVGSYDQNSTETITPLKLCGEETPTEFYLSSNKVYLKFVTDKSETMSGFSLFYNTIKYLFTEPSGVIESSSYAMNVTYKVLAPVDKKIELIIEEFDFSKCLIKDTNLLIESPNSACSLYNDHLMFDNERGNVGVEFYEEIDKLQSKNGLSSNWVFCACNRPAKTFVSLTNELNVKHFLAQSTNVRKDQTNNFKISYRFIPAEFSKINQLRIVQNQVKTNFIGGYFLNVNVPANSHLRLYGKSAKCTFPQHTLLAKYSNGEMQIMKHLSLATEDFKKNCSYLFDLSEPKIDEFSMNKFDWRATWFLKFDTLFDIYDFELNWIFIKNEIIDVKKSLTITFPKQIGFDFDNKQHDELAFHFRSSNRNRKYSLYFDIDGKFSNDIQDVNNYIKLRSKNTKQDHLIANDHLNNKANAMVLNSVDSILKIKRNEKFTIDIMVKINSQIGDCDFDASFCDYTTNLFVNSTQFPSIFASNNNEQFMIRHMPKYESLNTNDFDVTSKAKDFYLSIFKKDKTEEDESIYSPLIKVQEHDLDDSKKTLFNRKIHSLSFSYMMSENSKNQIELFLIQNRSDIFTSLQTGFQMDTIAHYSSKSHLKNIEVSRVQIAKQCPSTPFSALLNSVPKSSSNEFSLASKVDSDSTVNWYRVNKAKFFSCYDFRFAFGIKSNQENDSAEKIDSKSLSEFMLGLDDIELNQEGDVSECSQNICGSNGNCFEFNGKPLCCCNAGFEGERCETKLSACGQANSLLSDSSESVCKNGGKCQDSKNEFDYKCECAKGYTGKNCEIEIDECKSNPCHNNGKCIDRIGTYECFCKTGFSGRNCQKKDLDCKEKCSEVGTAECFNDRSNVFCKCKPDFSGDDCNFRIKLNKCLSNPCVGDSKCVNQANGFKCICPEDRTGNFCESKLDYCKEHENLCRNGSACIFANENATKFKCSCEAGFTGPHCDQQINDCESNPCANGKCIDLHLGYKCDCNKGFIGKNCDVIPKDPCYKNKCLQGTCMPSAASNYTCLCHNNFDGLFCEKEKCNKEKYLTKVCNKEGTFDVISHENRCLCLCNKDFTGLTCETRLNLCDLRSRDSEDECLNGGVCSYNNHTNQVKCQCKNGYFGDRCQLTENHCKSNPCLYGNCRSEKNTYKCSCTKGWEGINCDKRIDACNLEDDCVAQNTLQVLYSKKSCVCICKIGFSGEKCEKNIDNCASNQCQNNGKCFDLVGSYQCICPLGFSGPFCERKIENCELNPCKNGRCEMQGRQLTCICDRGYSGEFCEKFIDRCDPNPCKNKGKCHNLIDDYYCECPPEYGETKNCSIRLVNPCESSPCFNNATCFPIASGSYRANGKSVATYSGFSCRCQTNFKGELCELPADPCTSNPCRNRGNCVLSKDVHSYSCRCYPAFTGRNCESYFDPCLGTNLCKNGGSCLATPEGYKCKCPYNFGGENCETALSPCDLMKCQNDGICVVTNNVPSCKCTTNRFIGTRCEIDVSLVNSKLSPLSSRALGAQSSSSSCDVLGNEVSTIDFVLLALIIFALLILIIAVVYVYVYFGIKKTKDYYNQVHYDNEVLGEIGEFDKRFS